MLEKVKITDMHQKDDSRKGRRQSRKSAICLEDKFKLIGLYFIRKLLLVDTDS